LSSVLVDSNVILDVVTGDPQWGDWSSSMLARCAEGGMLVINPIIYAEVSIGFERIEELDEVLPAGSFRRDALPWEAAFLAGKCFLVYRRRGGSRRSPLPDFYIGAHAAVMDLPLLTRDPRRYRTYFPHLRILAPEEIEEEPA
jgi:predicted nucleic acid-binding protein